MSKKFRIIGLALVLILSVGLSACASNNNSAGGGKKVAKNLGSQKKITIPYVSWSGCIASTHVIAQVLKNAGYQVDLKQVGAGEMFSATASGSADGFMCAWLPATHKNYWNKYGSKLDKVQTTIDKAPLGLTVPTYMKNVNSISDLKGNTKLGKKLNWTITGIDPGAGEMQAAKKALKVYGLSKWSVQSSSGPAMTAALKSAEDSKKPIIVTLWKPHWAFGAWNLKILKDPKKVFGTADSINTIVRKGLKKDAPAAYSIFKNFKWGYKEENQVMNMDHKSKDPTKSAKKFVKNHQKLVKQWMKGVQMK